MKAPIGHPVSDLQRALREIIKAEGSQKLLVPDGVFGPETTRAVQKFQRDNGLNPSGKADSETWKAIFARSAELRRTQAPAERVPLFLPGSSAVPGSSGDAVLAVQIMLCTLSSNFSNFDPVERSGTYDENTARQIRRFQSCAGLRENGITDKETWNALCHCYGCWRTGATRSIDDGLR